MQFEKAYLIVSCNFIVAKSKGEKPEQHNRKVKITDLGAGLHGFHSQLYHLCAVLLQASYLTSLCLSFLTVTLRSLPLLVVIPM